MEECVVQAEDDDPLRMAQGKLVETAAGRNVSTHTRGRARD